ncbi:hypothetical protein BGX26_003320 [Mortierella sp. AD094]|nr:hypothetical protein BGX26_003320 [Mortierella sp. AD094]
MHQDHNIPWQTLAAHFLIAPGPNPSYTNKPLNFYPRERPDQGKAFTYFSNAFIKTIHEFAATERQKYPPTFPTQETGDLFTDGVIQDCQMRYSCSWRSDYLNKENQKIEYWINGGKDLGRLAEAATVLIIENQICQSSTVHGAAPIVGGIGSPSMPFKSTYSSTSLPSSQTIAEDEDARVLRVASLL